MADIVGGCTMSIGTMFGPSQNGPRRQVTKGQRAEGTISNFSELVEDIQPEQEGNMSPLGDTQSGTERGK